MIVEVSIEEFLPPNFIQSEGNVPRMIAVHCLAPQDWRI
jgi:hypothetical protein